ncbi:MAG: hypothetical protein WCT24_01295 [Patescibacteria group bacterium]
MTWDIWAIWNQLSLESIDWWVAAATIGIVFLFLFTIGRDFSVTFMISIYLALASMTLIPFLRDLDLQVGLEDYWVKIILFGVLVLLFFWFQVRNEFFEPYTVPTGGEVIVFIIVISGMLLYTVGTMLPDMILLEVSPIMKTLFIEEPASNIWFTLPLLTMLFLRGKT